jgi:uncharacterized protein
LFGITAGYRQLPAVGFIGFYFSLLVAALVFAWLWHRSGYSLLVVAVFHAVFDIATTTPTDTTLIPILMGAAISLAGLAAIPAKLLLLSRVFGGAGYAFVGSWEASWGWRTGATAARDSGL